MSLPRSGQAPLTSRVKIMANLDIAQKRVPQDGRARIRLDGVGRNIRVSTLPTLHGETVVIRLLADIGELPALTALGIPRDMLARVHQALRSHQGLVVITGPTGSGKTTTLYSAIHEVVTGDRNLITLEEPVEIELPGVSQVQIDEKTGMTFAAGLRSVLRQDPDIIMVGEIRDKTTADLAIRAALTGHLVLATVHTVDAPSAVIRLVDMGVPRYLIASSLTMVLAQRLVRRPCAYCLVADPPDVETRQRLHITDAQAALMAKGQGCERCDALGYRGRVGVFEVLPVSKDVRSALMSGGDEQLLARAAAPEGWKPLLAAGVEVAARQQTTTAELLRVLVSQ
jgi:type IV pilus assembly protein PilB